MFPNTLIFGIIVACMVVVATITCYYIYWAASVFFRHTKTGRRIWRKILRPACRAIYDLVFLACAMTRCPGVARFVLERIRQERLQRDALEGHC